MAYANLTLGAIFAFLTGSFLITSLSNLYLLLIASMLGGFLFWALTGATRAHGTLITVLICGFSVGCLYTSAYVNRHVIHIPSSGVGSFVGVITSDVRATNKGTREMVVVTQPPSIGTFHVSVPGYSTSAYGDLVRITGTVRIPEKRYQDWWITARTVTVIEHHHGWKLKTLLFAIRASFLQHVTMALPPREAALAAGLTIGDRAGFDPAFTADMAASGTTHLVALSGYNIAIIVSSLGIIFMGKFRRRTVVLITLGIIILFVLLVGAEASIVRAAVMGGLMIAAREFGRARSIHRAILFSAFCMCLVNPPVLRQVGFQLSFMSLLGVVYILPVIAAFLHIEPNPDAFIDWKEHLLASSAAQAAVFPILLLTFNQLSLSGIIANVFIVITVPVAMLLAFLTGFSGWIYQPIAYLCAWASYPVLHYQIMMIHFFAQVHIPFWFPNTLWAALLYYIVAAFITIRFHLNNHSSKSSNGYHAKT